MSWFYRKVVRPVLFNYDSEQIHDVTIGTLGRLSQWKLGCDLLKSFYGMPRLPMKLWGLEFPNPIGLAAGMDKKAAAVPAWAALGFGFSELGGVTAQGQPGNPPPRMFRAVADEALINRMGFNNPGAEAMAMALKEWRESGLWPKHPVGINLGKSKITPLEVAAEDYATSFRLLRAYADFFVVNVSSPNTPNLRQLQDRGALEQILKKLQELNQDGIHPERPLLVKVAPDLTEEALNDVVELSLGLGLQGIVATNTTVARPQTADEDLMRIYEESGGLSGKPLKARSTELIRYIHQRSSGKLPIIGVGGIFSAEDAWEKLQAGASLVQVYTGLVYEGPSICQEVVQGIAERINQLGFSSLSEFLARRNELGLANSRRVAALEVR
jgi:dihydroorotate dehydrogenase